VVVATAALSAWLVLSPTHEPAVVVLPGAEELRDQAADALRSATSLHFEITHEEGGTPLGSGLTLYSAEGDALFPDRAEMVAKTRTEQFGVTLDIGIIQIGPTTYLRDPIGRDWSTAPPESLPFDFTAMNDSLADALAKATDLTIVAGARVDGVATFVLTGRVRPQDFRGLVPNAPEGAPMELTAWVGQQDSLPRSVRLTGKLIAGDPASMTRLLKLKAFNKWVTVEPPI
jgi:hypothetical protein